MVNKLGNARKRVTALTEIMRWIWCINLIVTIVALAYKHYEVALIAGFTWMLALVAAAVGRNAARYLHSAESDTTDVLHAPR